MSTPCRGWTVRVWAPGGALGCRLRVGALRRDVSRLPHQPLRFAAT